MSFGLLSTIYCTVAETFRCYYQSNGKKTIIMPISMLGRNPCWNQCCQGIEISPMCNFLTKKCQTFAIFIFYFSQMLRNINNTSFWPNTCAHDTWFLSKTACSRIPKFEFPNFLRTFPYFRDPVTKNTHAAKNPPIKFF